jgi:zinc protease
MAVIAVGDFDKAKVIQLITDRFGRIPKPATPLTRPQYPVPPHESTYVAIATDKETPSSSVVLYALRPPHDQSTIGAYRQSMVQDLYDGMLNHRFNEMVQKPDPPFLGAQAGEGLLVRASEISVLAAGVQNGGIVRGLDAILTERERVARYGFTATEFEREKANLLRQYEELNAEADKRTSASHAAEMARNFLEGESIPGAAREYALHQQFLPTITLDDVNALARPASGSGSLVVLVDAPDKAGVPVPTEAEVLAAFDAVKAKTITPYADVVASAPLLATPPTPGAVRATRTIPAVGVTEWKLSNGVTVVLKPTDFQADQILLRGVSPGGNSLAPDSTYLSADFATAVVTAGGVGPFSAVDLGKELSGKIVSVSPFVAGRTEGILASASRKDLETMFQLVWLRFTAPRRDSMAFVAWRERLEAQLQNRTVTPAVAFYDTVNATLSQHAFRERPLTSDMVGQVSLDRALAFYRDRFADASDFTFVLVGNFDVDSVRPLVERYLGGLPSIHRKEAGRDLGIRPPTGVVERTVRRGVEPQSRTMIIFSGSFDWTRRNTYTLLSLRDLLQQRLTDKLREALGGTYSVGVFASADRDAPKRYALGVQFGSAPERADELSKAVFAEIQMLKDSGATAADLEKVTEAQRRSHETALRANGTWLNLLGEAWEYGDDPALVLTWDQLPAGLRSQSIRDAARSWLRSDNYVRVVLLPEK